MHVAVIQTSPIFGEPKSNVREALILMESIRADLYVLPELCNTGYNFLDTAEVERLAEPASGPTHQSISHFAEKRSCYVTYGFAEKAEALYNSAALVGPKDLIGVYRKVHLFDRENLFFTPGNLGFPVFDLPIGRIGMMICFDWFFPESMRTLTLKGAQLVVHPANLVLPYCPEAMVTRCLENRVFSITANRVGREDRGDHPLGFIGSSQIVSPRGEVLRRLGSDEPGVAVTEIDPHLADNKQLNQYNHLLQGRRTDQYR